MGQRLGGLFIGIVGVLVLIFSDRSASALVFGIAAVVAGVAFLVTKQSAEPQETATGQGKEPTTPAPPPTATL